MLPIQSAAVRPVGLPESTSSIGKAAQGGGSHEDFSSTIRSLLESANEPQLAADQALNQLATGQTDNVHEVVMSVVKADMSFRFVLELRNRLTDAYQELMRMQV